ncbi:MAG: hypothetical protein AAFO58_07930, partial [Pseudomonadota bacterium]
VRSRRRRGSGPRVSKGRWCVRAPQGSCPQRVHRPAIGAGPAEREHTTDLLKRAAQTRAVVVIEHDMEFVRRLDCKVTVLHEGSVLAEGTLDHVTQNQEVIDVYLGR